MVATTTGLSNIWLFKGTARLSTSEVITKIYAVLFGRYIYLQCCVCISRLAMDIRPYGTLSSPPSSSKLDQPEPPEDTSSSSDSDFECLDPKTSPPEKQCTTSHT